LHLIDCDDEETSGHCQSRPASKQSFQTCDSLQGLHFPSSGHAQANRKRKNASIRSDVRALVIGDGETHARWATPAFETWRLESDGMSGHVRISEFADMRPPTPAAGMDKVDAYKRPANKRDLGHRCRFCRRPFNMLGSDIVAEPEQGPTQRFHPECWRKHLARESGLASDEGKSLSRSLNCKHRNKIGRADFSESVVDAYAEEWRLAPASRVHSSHSSRKTKSGATSRISPLEGLFSIEDINGEKHIARGFSTAEIQTVVSRWACEPANGDDCAVCLAHQERPLRLPCGHVFCGECVVPWLKKCALCPMCREDMRPHLDDLQPLRGLLLPNPSKATGGRSVPNLRSQGWARSCDGRQDLVSR